MMGKSEMEEESAGKRLRKRIFKRRRERFDGTRESDADIQATEEKLPSKIPGRLLGLEGMVHTSSDTFLEEPPSGVFDISGLDNISANIKRLWKQMKAMGWERELIKSYVHDLLDLESNTPNPAVYGLLENIITNQDPREASLIDTSNRRIEWKRAIHACTRLEESKRTSFSQAEENQTHSFTNIVYSIWSLWEDSLSLGADMAETVDKFMKLKDSPTEILILFREICKKRAEDPAYKKYIPLGSVATELAQVKDILDKRRYELVATIAEKDRRNEYWRMYRHILELPDSVPGYVFSMLSNAFETCPDKFKGDDLLKQTMDTVESLQKLFHLYDNQFLKRNFYLTERSMAKNPENNYEVNASNLQKFNEHLRTMRKEFSHNRKDITIAHSGEAAERAELMQAEQLAIDHAKLAKLLLENHPKIYSRLDKKIKRLDKSNLTSKQITDFIKLYFDNVIKGLEPHDREQLGNLLLFERQLATQKTLHRSDLEKLLAQDPTPCHKELKRFVKKQFGPSMDVDVIIDLSLDSMHWYDTKALVRTYNELRDAYADDRIEMAQYDKAIERFAEEFYIPSDLKRTSVQYTALVSDGHRFLLGEHPILRDKAFTAKTEKPDIALIGWGCGTAKREVYLYKKLEEYFTPHLHLIDKNEDMLAEACLICDENGIEPFTHTIDFIRDFSPAKFSSLDMPVLATFFGGTPFNLDERWKVFDDVRKIFLNLSPEDRDRSMMLIEGHKTKDKRFYTDNRSKDFFALYLGNRLGIPYERITDEYGNLTHFTSYNKKEKRLDIYYIITKDHPATTDRSSEGDETATSSLFRKGNIVKVGYSGKLDVKEFNRKMKALGFSSESSHRGTHTIVTSQYSPKLLDRFWAWYFRRKYKT
ncbi:hypothetical protein ACFL96_05085 [Thermoproteota archaeon]